jgi:hypothetical protein
MQYLVLTSQFFSLCILRAFLYFVYSGRNGISMRNGNRALTFKFNYGQVAQKNSDLNFLLIESLPVNNRFIKKTV